MATYFEVINLFTSTLFDLSSPFTWLFWAFFVVGLIVLLVCIIKGKLG